MMFNVYFITVFICYVKSTKGIESKSYLDEFWSMTERIGKSYLDHIIHNREMDFKECEFKCPNKS